MNIKNIKRQFAKSICNCAMSKKETLVKGAGLILKNKYRRTNQI